MIEYFTDPYPDEILYSVWARYSDHVRYSSKRDVLRELFGSWSHQTAFDFPCHLGYFVDHLPLEHLYTADWFIDHHTLLPFYSPFLPPERFRRIRERMITGGGNSPVHRIVGVVKPTTPAPLWLRYCPLCVAHDRELFGECYWHRLHQVLGVEICPIHSTFLENSAVPTGGRTAARDFIPAERTIQTTPPRKAVISPFYKELMDIAVDAHYLLTHPIAPSDADFLRRQYHALLSHRGFIARNGHIRVDLFLVSFTDYYPPELLDLLHSALKQVSRPGTSWPVRMMLSSGSQHPLRHLLALRFLGLKAETLFEQDLQPRKPFGDGPWPCLNPACEHFQKRNIVSYQQSVGTQRLVGRFACECGFIYTRRGPDRSPEDAFRRERILSFGASWEMKLREYWSDLTLSSKEMSSRLGINRQLLVQQARKLQLPVPRNPSWKKTSKEPKTYSLVTISRYREQWQILMGEFPGESRTFLQKKRSNLYRWLYCHDKEWFMSHSPLPKKRQPRTSLRVKLQFLGEATTREEKTSLDIRTADAVYSAAHSLMTPSDPPQKVTLKAILKEVPRAARAKSRPDLYPKTTQALKEVVETSEAFVLRKIRVTLQSYLEERTCPRPWQFLQRSHLKRYNLRSDIVQQALDEAMTVLSQF